MQVHHIGYLIENMEQSIQAFSELGFSIKQISMYDDDRDVDICFMENGGSVVELIAPRTSCKSFCSLKKKIGNAPYHICYVADDFVTDIQRLENKGYCIIVPPAKAVAISNRQVAFLYNKEIGMIEVVER